MLFPLSAEVIAQQRTLLPDRRSMIAKPFHVGRADLALRNLKFRLIIEPDKLHVVGLDLDGHCFDVVSARRIGKRVAEVLHRFLHFGCTLLRGCLRRELSVPPCFGLLPV